MEGDPHLGSQPQGSWPAVRDLGGQLMSEPQSCQPRLPRWEHGLAATTGPSAAEAGGSSGQSPRWAPLPSSGRGGTWRPGPAGGAAQGLQLPGPAPARPPIHSHRLPARPASKVQASSRDAAPIPLREAPSRCARTASPPNPPIPPPPPRSPSVQARLRLLPQGLGAGSGSLDAPAQAAAELGEGGPLQSAPRGPSSPPTSAAEPPPRPRPASRSRGLRIAPRFLLRPTPDSSPLHPEIPHPLPTHPGPRRAPWRWGAGRPCWRCWRCWRCCPRGARRRCSRTTRSRSSSRASCRSRSPGGRTRAAWSRLRRRSPRCARAKPRPRTRGRAWARMERVSVPTVPLAWVPLAGWGPGTRASGGAGASPGLAAVPPPGERSGSVRHGTAHMSGDSVPGRPALARSPVGTRRMQQVCCPAALTAQRLVQLPATQGPGPGHRGPGCPPSLL